jgi:hypothetical chaperone protein
MTPNRNSSTLCGIDFGTSNTTISVLDAAGARLIPLEDGAVTLPSSVFFEADTVAAEFGRAGIAAYVRGDDGRLMRGLKSTLGSSLIHEKTRVGARVLSFRDIVARYFGHLRICLDAETGGGVTRAVLGRPVHFVDGDPAGDCAAQDVLEDIARAHGFREVAFQYEPIAAALHYEQGIAAEELVLIVDIGGGTSDFSIVRVGPVQARAADRSADILANDGVRVGGTDFDRLLSLAEVMPHLGFGSTTGQGKAVMPKHYYLDLATWHRINMLYSGKTASDLKALAQMSDRPELIARMIKVVAGRQGHGLAMAVEAAKIDLSEHDLARLQISALTGGPNPLVRRDGFEASIGQSLARISGLLTAVLVQAGLTSDRIGTVFLTGGSSGLPALRQVVASVLPGVPVATGDMLGSVGTGLALEAARRFR